MAQAPSRTRLARRSLLAGAVGIGAIVLGARMRNRTKRNLEQALAELAKNDGLPPASTIAIDAEPDVHARFLDVAPATSEPGLPIVLVPPTPSTCYAFAPLLRGTPSAAGLSARRRAIAFEPPGHGIAPRAAGRITFARCARALIATLDALDLERVHLLGASYGGETAWRAALDHPGRFASLTLLDSAGVPRREGDWLSEEVAMRELAVAKIGWLLNSRARIRSALDPHFDPLPQDSLEEVFLCCSNANNWSAMVDLARDENGTRFGEIGGLAVPTLLGWGERDLAYEPAHYAAAFQQQVPNARLHLFADTGHYPHEERPEALLPVLAEHLERNEA